MTLPEKLKQFEAYTLAQAQKHYQAELKALTKTLETEAHVRTQATQQSLNTRLDDKYAHMQAGKQARLATARHTHLVKLSKLRQAHQLSVREAVRQALVAYANSPAYLAFLKLGVSPFLQAGHQVIISTHDAPHLGTLSSPTLAATGAFIGGFIAYLPPNQVCDNTFDTALLRLT